MAETREVQEVFSLVDNATGPLKNIANSMQGVQMRAERASMGIERMLVPALGLIGVGYGIKGFGNKIWEVAEAADSFKTKITAAWIASGRFEHAGPAKNLAASMVRGKEAFEEIEEMATRGVAPMATYAGVYSAIALPALEKTKISQKDLLKFSEDLVPVLGSISGNTQMAAYQAKQFGMVLAGAGGRPPRELLKAISMSQKEFTQLRKKGVEPMFAEIKKRVAENAPLFKTLFEDPGVQIQRLKETANQLFRILGEPVMDNITIKAQELLKYVRENKEHVFAVAREWGTKLSVGFDHVVEAAKFIREHIVAIGIGIATIKFAPHILEGFKLLSAFSGGPSSKHFGGGGGGGVGVIKDVIPLFGKLGEALKAAMSNGPTSIMDGIGNLGKALSGAVGTGGIVALGLAAFALALHHTAEELDDWQRKRIVARGDLQGGLSVLETLGKKGTSKYQTDAMDPADAAKNLARLSAQKSLLRSMGREGLLTAGGEMIPNMKAVMQQRYTQGMSVAESGPALQQAAKVAEFMSEVIRDNWTPERVMALLAKPADMSVAEKGKPPEVNFNHNTFNIKQAFAEGFDPDRIAVAFTQDLVQLGERALSSNLAPAGTGV